jgi:hypothetical protein
MKKPRRITLVTARNRVATDAYQKRIKRVASKPYQLFSKDDPEMQKLSLSDRARLSNYLGKGALQVKFGPNKPVKTDGFSAVTSERLVKLVDQMEAPAPSLNI